MPRGPNGEKRPADVVGCAVTVMKIATGEIDEDLPAHRDIKVNGGKANGLLGLQFLPPQFNLYGQRDPWDGPGFRPFWPN